MTADLTDAEIDEICAGLVQNCAKVRHLRRLGLIVRQKPNGKPLVNRKHYDAVMGPPVHSITSTPAANGARGPAWSVAA